MRTKMKREQFSQTSDASIILSTSSYIGEGIDIGHLDTIVFTMPISYDERMVQYLGRIGRSGQKCLAVDFIDKQLPLLKSSFTKRLKGYKKIRSIFRSIFFKISNIHLFNGFNVGEIGHHRLKQFPLQRHPKQVSIQQDSIIRRLRAR